MSHSRVIGTRSCECQVHRSQPAARWHFHARNGFHSRLAIIAVDLCRIQVARYKSRWWHLRAGSTSCAGTISVHYSLERKGLYPHRLGSSESYWAAPCLKSIQRRFLLRWLKTHPLFSRSHCEIPEIIEMALMSAKC